MAGPVPGHAAARRPQLVWWLFTVALFAAVGGAFAWTYTASERLSQDAAARRLRGVQLHGIIVHLDEVLTMSARMNAATGDGAWERRYHEFEPKLDAAIKEAMALEGPTRVRADSAETDQANQRLVAMEMRSFGLTAAGRPVDASRLLFSAEYETQKRIYADGMERLLNQLNAQLDQTARAERRTATITMLAGSVALFVSLMASVLVIERLRESKRALQRVSDERQRAVELAGERETQLLESREAALAGSQAKSEFLATMSHEIRTPMNGVIGFTNLLLETPLVSDQREFAETIRHSAHALLAIVNDILDFSKVEAGKLALENSPFDLRSAVEDVAELMAQTAEAKGVAIVLQMQPDLPARVIGDVGRVRQVLLNLVGNAIKFTHEGHVLVELRREPGAGPTVRIAVTDTGIGIPLDKQPHLFSQFMQADASTARRFGGTGLGLAISKRLVELMGGTIGVQSVPGQGSTFWFTLALPEEAYAEPERPSFDGAASAPARSRIGPPGEPRRRVLLAEDNQVNQRLAVYALNKLGCVVDVAADGREAVDLVKQLPYDCVFMDCHMPELDGFEATAQIRAMQAGGVRVPIVALTANAMPGDRERCLAAGMDDYISKPMHQDDLRRMLALWAPAAAPVGAV